MLATPPSLFQVGVCVWERASKRERELIELRMIGIVLSGQRSSLQSGLFWGWKHADVAGEVDLVGFESNG